MQEELSGDEGNASDAEAPAADAHALAAAEARPDGALAAEPRASPRDALGRCWSWVLLAGLRVPLSVVAAAASKAALAGLRRAGRCLAHAWQGHTPAVCMRVREQGPAAGVTGPGMLPGMQSALLPALERLGSGEAPAGWAAGLGWAGLGRNGRAADMLRRAAVVLRPPRAPACVPCACRSCRSCRSRPRWCRCWSWSTGRCATRRTGCRICASKTSACRWGQDWALLHRILSAPSQFCLAPAVPHPAHAGGHAPAPRAYPSRACRLPGGDVPKQTARTTAFAARPV